MKQKAEPLIINEIQMIDDDEEDDLKVSSTNIEIERKERMIEKFNSGETTQKYFVPRKEAQTNNTAPTELGKKQKVSIGIFRILSRLHLRCLGNKPEQRELSKEHEHAEELEPTSEVHCEIRQARS